MVSRRYVEAFEWIQFKHQKVLESSIIRQGSIGVNVFDGTEILCKELVIWKTLILVLGGKKIRKPFVLDNNAKVEIGLST